MEKGNNRSKFADSQADKTEKATAKSKENLIAS